MRLFIAAELPQELHDALCETSASLRDAVRGRYVAPDLFHVTLAFLGELPATDVPLLSATMGEACLGYEAFSTTLGPLGTFGRSSAAVLWQGFSDSRGEWDELAHAVRSSVRAQGFSVDETSFLPHVTLMRKADVSAGILPMPHVATGVIRRVSLFSSDLSGPRPRYEALVSHDLGTWGMRGEGA